MNLRLLRSALALLMLLSVSPTPGQATVNVTRKYYFPVISKAPAPAPGTLKADANPVEAGSTINVSWNIANFGSGSLDRGDGQGAQVGLTAASNFAVTNLTVKRVVRVEWKDTSNRSFSDLLTLYPMTRVAGTLGVNTNPTRRGNTATASWWLPNYANGEFDAGDGGGYKGPINANMLVDMANWQGGRNLRLRWRTTIDDWYFDTLNVGIFDAAGGNLPDCNSGNPDWRGNDPPYQFCVRQDLEWADGGNPVRHFAADKERVLTMKWLVYGVNGIRLKIEPSSQVCGPAGPDGRDLAVNGNDGTNPATYTFNAKDFRFGGYKIELFITRRDGQVVGYNEKFLCMGN